MKEVLKVIGSFALILLAILLIVGELYVAFVLGVKVPIAMWEAGYQVWAIVQGLLVLGWLLGTHSNRGDN